MNTAKKIISISAVVLTAIAAIVQNEEVRKAILGSYSDGSIRSFKDACSGVYINRAAAKKTDAS